MRHVVRLLSWRSNVDRAYSLIEHSFLERKDRQRHAGKLLYSRGLVGCSTANRLYYQQMFWLAKSLLILLATPLGCERGAVKDVAHNLVGIGAEDFSLIGTENRIAYLARLTQTPEPQQDFEKLLHGGKDNHSLNTSSFIC